MNDVNGFILKALGGFYYVETHMGTIECRARGKFRKDEVFPCVGDNVNILVDANHKGTVNQVLPRSNCIARPPIANLDQLIIVASICDPTPSTLVIDKLVAIAEYKDIEPVIVITKSDLAAVKHLEQIYSNAGFKVLVLSNNDPGENFNKLKAILTDKISAFTGNTGVGKSSLLNHIDDTLFVQTAEISEKLGRGKHTTRHTELFKLPFGGYIADTPGFGAVELEKYEMILKEKLQFCFREFSPYAGHCKYNDCSHTVENGCCVLEALKDGKIEQSRHHSYVCLYNDAKNIKEWEH